MDLSLVHTSLCATAGLSATLLAYGIASAPSRCVQRLGYRGLKRRRALRESSFAMVEPLVGWLALRIGGLLPVPAYKWIDRQLVLSGDYLGLTPEEYAAASILGFAASVGSSALYVRWGGALVAAIVFAVAGSLLLHMQVTREIDRRSRDIGRGLPYVIDLLALSMSAGLDFPGAVQMVCRSENSKDALNEELERMLHELALGHSRREALENFADRTSVSSAIEFVAAIVQSEQKGSPLADTLMIQAQVSRQQRSLRAETEAAKKATAIYLPLAILLMSVLTLVVGPLVLKMNHLMELQ